MQLFILLAFILFAQPTLAEIVVITHPQTALANVSAEQLRKSWLSEAAIINGQRFEIIDLDEKNPVRGQFYNKVVKVSDDQLKAHWAIRVFRGEGLPPEMKAEPSDVLHWVSQQPNRLGYLDSKDANDSVKIIFRAE